MIQVQFDFNSLLEDRIQDLNHSLSLIDNNPLSANI